MRVLDRFESIEELEETIRKVIELHNQGLSYAEISKQIFGTSRDRTLFYWIYRIIQSSKKYGPEHVIAFQKKRFLSFKTKIEEPSEEEIEEYEEEEKELKEEKKRERALKQTSTRAILSQLNKYVKQVSLDKLKQIIENGLLLEEYEEEIKRREIERLKQAYINEKARRELLNEAFFYFLAGMMDRKTLAKIVLSCLFDEVFDIKPMEVLEIGEKKG